MKRKLLFTVMGMLVFWTGMTIWVQLSGPALSTRVGEVTSPKRALIVYNPDPIYNLDAQVCQAMAQGLADEDYFVHIETVAKAKFDHNKYDLLVICANTYNWAPDWKISGFVRRYPDLVAKPTVAMTLGSGSTARSQRLLEERLRKRNAVILDSRTYWLMRPNDENRMEAANTQVAQDQVYAWGREIGQRLHVSRTPRCLDYGRYDD